MAPLYKVRPGIPSPYNSANFWAIEIWDLCWYGGNHQVLFFIVLLETRSDHGAKNRHPANRRDKSYI